MIKSEQINDLAAALSKAQSIIKGATKDANNPFFKSQYADLTSVWVACREALTSNGLSVVQCPEQSECGGVAVETTLLHSSGQFITSRYVMPVKNATDAQAVGSAITYARRYALSAMVGIAPTDDDDGNGASGNYSKDQKNDKPPQKLNQEQVKVINDLIGMAGITDTTAFCKYYKVRSPADMTTDMYDGAIKLLKKKIDELEDIPQ